MGGLNRPWLPAMPLMAYFCAAGLLRRPLIWGKTNHEASRRTRPSGGGLRKQSRQLPIILAHAAVVPAFLHVLTRNDAGSARIHASNFGELNHSQATRRDGDAGRVS
jgi:hypothetical protein